MELDVPENEEAMSFDLGHQQDEEEDHVKAFISNLSPTQRACVKALESLHSDFEALAAKQRKELRAIDRKYEELSSPIFLRRANIISGEDQGGDTESKGIPGFWLRAMKQNAGMRENITERDEHVLKDLMDIRCSTLPEEEGVGFRIEFFFRQNNFFSNTTLTKTYYMEDSEYDEVERAKGTEIQWKEGRNLTVKTTKKRQRKKNSHETRVVVKTEPCESFFNFFSPPVLPQIGEGPVDSEELEQRRDELSADLDLGLSFFDELVPSAVKWFTGEDSKSSDSEFHEESEKENSDGETDASDDSQDADFEAGEGEGSKDEVDAFIQTLPELQQKSVQLLLELDAEAKSLSTGKRREMRALDRKYEQLCSPIFAERARIVSGETSTLLDGAEGGGIPGFWLELMKNCRIVRDRITERDEAALQHLVDVVATTLPELPVEEHSETESVRKWCFRLEFIFRPNEFFVNPSLVKTYWLADSDHDEILSAESSTIQWNEGKCLTMKMVRKKRRSRNGRGIRTMLRSERCDSFFHFFSPPQPPAEGADEDDDEDAQERYEEELEADGEVDSPPKLIT